LFAFTYPRKPIHTPAQSLAQTEIKIETTPDVISVTQPAEVSIPAAPPVDTPQATAPETPSPSLPTASVVSVVTEKEAEKLNTAEKTNKKPGEKLLAFGSGPIRNSLVSSGKKAGLDYKVINQMIEIFGGKIDFSTDLRPNDSFRVLYEEKVINGKKTETGHILAVEFVNQGEKYQAVRFTDKAGHSAYFSPDGNGLNEAFLRSPVQFVNISSSFGMRKHPVCHKMRLHKGIDYRAPHGTPVVATANAKVVFAGKKGGYGNAIELQHGARYSTLYAHLSRFAKNIKTGMEVRQGQIIGYVGRTGLATGDHLHYEFRIDGNHRNPLTAAMPKQNSIAPAHRPQFIAHAKAMIRLLDVHQNMKGMKTKMASNDYQRNIAR
jgi:murein DD-endopeptidase MepM/ murein hydrolase activator NlpD